MGYFGTAYGCGWGEGWTKKSLSLNKTCHTYPAMMKLGTVIPYLKKIYMNHVRQTFSFADMSIFSLEISKFCYIKKNRYGLRFNE